MVNEILNIQKVRKLIADLLAMRKRDPLRPVQVEAAPPFEDDELPQAERVIARSGEVLGMVVRDGVQVATVGLVVGLVGAAALRRFTSTATRTRPSSSSPARSA